MSMVKEICFVTGNPFKVLHARVALRDFGVSVVSKQVEMIEPREEEPEMVARQKALQAFKVLNQPLMVEDSGLFILGLNGFPKTFIHFVERTIGVANIIKMMAGVDNREVEFHQSLAYIEPGLSGPEIFSYVDGGYTLADRVWETPSGEGWGEFDRILIPPGETKALCTFSPEWRARQDADKNKDTIHYHQLAKWLAGR
ncbi:MAG: deoxyribonucleotide triphosphate pyrophosphatase [Candidatus Amesbacteria bacterium GW2011_GWA1_47_16]|uniref:Deoxyribonucleotide triphosphate pyrophosphatase n=1 Tax=Candidatus Amesbacteria bacterium GW2011_GWA1_47_16 TaxID=1618353 RepID=A0A0G1U9Z4_9BACT|nr:MAG: deoxyribonucleotide triphosphate pyrophosphatase [Candidatus Amesbacteria bacterium GW2011_GWA1_47_16]